MMKTSEWNFKSFDNLELYAREWTPDGDMKAALVLVHGHGEHIGRYAHVGAMLAQHGYGLFGFDLRGHGKSGGPRGHAPSFEAYMNDIDQMLGKVKNDHPGKPIFLYGHSLGGVLVLDYILLRKPELNGAIVTSPSLRTAVEEQKLKVILAKLLGSIAPAGTLPTALDANMLSHDSEVVQNYKEDALVHDTISFGVGKTMIRVNQWTLEHASEFHLPLLLMHGTEDKIAYPSGSQDFASQVKGDCTLKLWEGMWHETHNELEKEKVFEYLLEWLAKH
jgi:alpha-beta hydrolase superfamily lysophospholipase